MLRLAFSLCVSDAIESQLMIMLQRWHADDKSIKNYARITIFYATFAICNVFNSWLLVALIQYEFNIINNAQTNERIDCEIYDNF